MLAITGYIVSLRLWAIPLAFVLYILYQRFIRKKPFSSLTNDIGVSVFFIIVYIALYMFLIKAD